MAKFEIIHELPASSRHPYRLRGRFAPARTSRMARAVSRGLANLPGISGVTVSPLTGTVLFYAATSGQRDDAVDFLEKRFSWREHTRISAEEVEDFLSGESPGGALFGVARYFLLSPLLPPVCRMILGAASAVPFLVRGWRSLCRGKLDVDALDASALLISMLMRDYRTVGMLTMLLSVGEALEVWTRQSSLSSLGLSLALNVDRVWMVDENGTEVSVPLGQIRPGDRIAVKDGSSIPVDGIVESGRALVNQASMTGEPVPVARERGGAVFAGAIVEAGSITIRVTQTGEGTRLNQVISFIRQSESRKSALEARYASLADKAVPFTFALAGIVLLSGGSLMRAASVLLVDYSCAIKLATPLAVLTAMRMGAKLGIAIRGGRYLEAMREANTLALDKTGTITSATPSVVSVIPAPGRERDEILRIMACLEEHFPHPVSRAIVQKARDEHLRHEEEHTDVQYVVAHGIVSSLHGRRMYFGSRHYLEHDEGVDLSVFSGEIARETALGRSLLFLSEDGAAAGMVVIEDPVRPEAPAVIDRMRRLGFGRVVMLTGDDERTARAVAGRLGITEFRAHVLPADKGRIVRELEDEGRKVMMVGDGINDGPALSAASVGIAMGDGTDLARAVANVLLTRPTLEGLPVARLLSTAAIARIHFNVALALGLNSAYLLGAISGLFTPGLTAALHNLTTIAIAFNAIRPYSIDLPKRAK